MRRRARWTTSVVDGRRLSDDLGKGRRPRAAAAYMIEKWGLYGNAERPAPGVAAAGRSSRARRHRRLDDARVPPALPPAPNVWRDRHPRVGGRRVSATASCPTCWPTLAKMDTRPRSPTLLYEVLFRAAGEQTIGWRTRSRRAAGERHRARPRREWVVEKRCRGVRQFTVGYQHRPRTVRRLLRRQRSRGCAGREAGRRPVEGDPVRFSKHMIRTVKKGEGLQLLRAGLQRFATRHESTT